jgi:hypothetical protein
VYKSTDVGATVNGTGDARELLHEIGVVEKALPKRSAVAGE